VGVRRVCVDVVVELGPYHECVPVDEDGGCSLEEDLDGVVVEIRHDGSSELLEDEVLPRERGGVR
jgi:hypothetical protein